MTENMQLLSVNEQKNNLAMTPLYTPKQVYDIEKKWFDATNPSYGLMCQAAWQIARWIDTTYKKSPLTNELTAYVWVGSGNNGGDGWLVASYLTQLGNKVTVIEVGIANTHDANLAKQDALSNHVRVFSFENELHDEQFIDGDVFVDALFGIGLDRKPTGKYGDAIQFLNQCAKTARFRNPNSHVVAVDVPSGLMASTGQVFEDCAVKADVTLCLVARKIGLHIKDGQDYAGEVIDFPLIPSVLSALPTAWLQEYAHPIAKRHNNSHKGSYGHVLIIGGNQVANSQGMGGAAILSAGAAFATGVGKLTVACHNSFHGSLLANLPNAMTLDITDSKGVCQLVDQCDVVTIGMGLGRDVASYDLFVTYLHKALQVGVDIVIDADGLYHLAELAKKDDTIVEQLKSYASSHHVCYTPHSGEAARLLSIQCVSNQFISRNLSDAIVADSAVNTIAVEANRIKAISILQEHFGGSWLLKGAGSIVMENGQTYVCAVGNAGMATAGMGDVLSGLVAGLMAQADLATDCRSLQQAVMIHAIAGDKLALQTGEWALQATDMAKYIGEVMSELTVKR